MSMTDSCVYLSATIDFAVIDLLTLLLLLLLLHLLLCLLCNADLHPNTNPHR